MGGLGLPERDQLAGGLRLVAEDGVSQAMAPMSVLRSKTLPPITASPRRYQRPSTSLK